MADSTKGARPSTEQGTGSDGKRSANADRSDGLNDNNDAKKAADANQAEQKRRGS